MILMLLVGILVVNPKNYFTRWANHSRGLLNRDKQTIGKIWQHAHTHHPLRCSFGEKKNVTHLMALSWSRSVPRPFKDPFDSSTRSKGVASQKIYTLSFAITRVPVSLLLSAGDV